MKTTTLIISLFLSLAAYDLNLFRRRRYQYDAVAIETTLTASELQLKKKIQRQRFDVIPSWHRDHRKPARMRMNYFSTKPRDARFSNQKKIRRMFNNA